MTKRKRRKDWLRRLEAYIEESRNGSFRWGEQDCALWVAGGIRAMTGHDPAAAYRGAYSNRSAGYQRLKDRGYTSPGAYMDANFDPCPPGHANIGDVVWMDGDTLGIVQGRFAWAMGPGGVVLCPMEAARRAWHV